MVHGAQKIFVHHQAAALIGQCRIDEAVAQNPLAARQCGPNQFGHVLRARRAKQQHFGARHDRLCAMQQLMTHAFSQRRAAGFARGDDAVSALAQPVVQTLPLRGFAATVDAFE